MAQISVKNEKKMLDDEGLRSIPIDSYPTLPFFFLPDEAFNKYGFPINSTYRSLPLMSRLHQYLVPTKLSDNNHRAGRPASHCFQNLLPLLVGLQPTLAHVV